MDAKSRTPSVSSKKHDPIIYLILFLVCTLAVILWRTPWKDLTVGLFLPPGNGGSMALPKVSLPSPSPTPLALSAGDGIYAVSHPKGKGPIIHSVTFSPLDVQKNQRLRVQVTLSSSSPLVKVIGSLQSDALSTELTFTKIGQTNNEETWSTEFIVKDTVSYTYILNVVAANQAGETVITVAPRS